MPHADTNFLTLDNINLQELAGKEWAVNGGSYWFKGYDPKRPRKNHPWRPGAEGTAYPLLGSNGLPVSYLKCLFLPNQQRLDRTAWLLGQRIHEWTPQLAAAPWLWMDTRQSSRPHDVNFDFSGCLSKAVPGVNWISLKRSIMKNDGTRFDTAQRWRAVDELIIAAAVLEQAQICHGDLSHNNIIVNLAASIDHPLLYLIDFDSFAAPRLDKKIASVSVADGGVVGTMGYCPPDLIKRREEGDTSVAPYSDRYGRDMLLLELLLAIPGIGDPEDSLERWKRDQLQTRYNALRERVDSNRLRLLDELQPQSVFTLAEDQRPSSVELARTLKLTLPLRIPDRPKVSIWLPSKKQPAISPSIPTGQKNLVTSKKKKTKKSSINRITNAPLPSAVRHTVTRQTSVPLVAKVSRTYTRVKPHLSNLFEGLGELLSIVACIVVLGILVAPHVVFGLLLLLYLFVRSLFTG